MIEINILRERLEKFRGRLVFSRVIMGYLFGLLFVFSGVFGKLAANRIQINSIQRNIARVRASISQEQSVVNQIQTYQARMENLLKKLALCETELADRPVWTEKVRLIGESLPPGMWLTRITVSQGSQWKSATEQKGNTFFLIDGFVSQAGTREREALASFLTRLSDQAKKEFDTVILREVSRVETKEGMQIAFKVECLVQGKKP